MSLKIATIQTKLSWQDRESNLINLESKIENLPATDIIVLPEMFSTGFSMETSLAEEIDGTSVKWMKKVASSSNSVLTGSLMIREGKSVFNRLIWMFPEGKLEYYDKRHLFRMAGEHLHFTGGSRRLIIQYKDWKICPMVCYDLRFPVWSRNRFMNGEFDYDILLYVANWPEKRSHAWNSLLPARAIENQAYVIGVNRVGVDGNDINYSGDSGVYNFLGEKMSKSDRYGEKTEIIELNKQELDQYREVFPASEDADSFELKI
ncbi:MAG: amidohydrolase [Bacteroidia bacterium]